MDVNSQEKVLEEIFSSIDIIAKKRIEETAFTQTIKARIIEKIPNSDMYRVQYQTEELRAMAMGGTEFNQGDTVYILVPDKRLDNLKFILGRTNERTATATSSQTGGLSPEVLAEIQEYVLTIERVLSDKRITPAEKEDLLNLYNRLHSSYYSVIAQADNHEVSHSDLDALYTAMVSFDVVLDNMSTETTETDLIAIMNKNFTDMKNAFSNYFAGEQSLRIDILDRIASYKQYQVTIDSSNGNLFVNGEINTTLIANVYKGFENITLTVPSSSIKWRKMNQDGSIDPSWSRTGSAIEITNADLSMKAVFIVEVYVEEAKVATSQLTLVDFSDAKGLQLFVQPNHPTIQIFNVDNQTFNPDWQSDNLVLTLSAFTTSSNTNVVSSLSNVIWKENGVVIDPLDPDYEIMANKSLKVKKNVLQSQDFVRYEVTGTYNDGGVAIQASAMAEFTKISISTAGGTEAASILYTLTPDGTVFRNADQEDTMRIQTVYMEGAVQIISNLTYKWFYADPSVIVGDSNYDSDGGPGWSLISATNDGNGAYSGYTGPTLNVKAKGVDNSETFKVSVKYGAKPALTSFATLVDITDPHQVIIEGDNVFKNGVGTLNLRARVLLNGTEILDLTGYTFEWSAYDSNGILYPSWSASTQSVEVDYGEVPEKGYFTCDVSLT